MNSEEISTIYLVYICKSPLQKAHRTLKKLTEKVNLRKNKTQITKKKSKLLNYLILCII